ncbi:Endoglucanase [Actinidia chinensis var. chinensis]|uniref:Endoglucanase n=1 Tax=Actinidia chinensis var. chinensis TaxID=1590841 RepID=A0A2R6PHV8_ACTCC|nr:Endoglucanase [Actinidia chinensis var. chinensis]
MKILQTILFSLILFLSPLSTHSLSLSTRSRWIVTSSGDRYKLRCVNWVGHLHAMVPEGLHKQPIKAISASVSSMGFNCVRLTWATYMFTRPNYTKLTVEESLDQWGLKNAKAGMAENNPNVLGLSLWEAQKAVIDGLGAQNITVVLDNHVSLPKWCCGSNDGNGFFGDEYFDPNEWLLGLSTVARRYKGNPTVVAMSMRNELRGPHQNQEDWYKYMQQGATTIHKENPDVLVIVSGLATDTNLGFLKTRPIQVDINNKLVYEAHWYAFGNPPDKWLYETNGFCGNVTQWFMGQSGFLTNGPNPAPLFLSEFGLDQRGGNEADTRYFSCLLGHVAEMDMDWALWTLQGSYMLREGVFEMEEFYGMLNANWDHVRNSTFQKSLQLIQQITQDPTSNSATYQIMYHPQTGQCVQVGNDNIYLSDCKSWGRWSHDTDGGPIKLMGGGGSRCLVAAGDGLPAAISGDCSGQQSMWALVSGSQFHIATKDNQGNFLCLDWDSSKSSTILTKKCLCLGSDSKDVSKCEDNPQRQWFKLVPSNKI